MTEALSSGDLVSSSVEVCLLDSGMRVRRSADRHTLAISAWPKIGLQEASALLASL